MMVASLMGEKCAPATVPARSDAMAGAKIYTAEAGSGGVPIR